MRRLLIALVLVAVIGLAGLMAIPQIVSIGAVQREVARYASQLTGFNVAIRGDTSFSVWPDLRFRVRDVGLSSKNIDAPEVAAMDELSGTIDPLRLIRGEISIKSFTLVRPKLTLVSTPDGQNNWTASREGSVESAVSERKEEGQTDSRLRIGTMRVEEGTVHHQTGQEEPIELTGINGTISWPRGDAGISAQGDFIYHGTKVDATLRAEDPIGALSGTKSTLSAKLTSSLFELLLDGNIIGGSEFQFNGVSTLSSNDPRAFAKWLGGDLGGGSGLNAFKLSGMVNLVNGLANIQTAQLDIDGQTAEGALTIGLDEGRPSLKGTLAADTVDLTAYFSGSEDAATAGDTPAGQTPQLSGLPGLLARLEPYDLDLRVSAARLTFPNLAVGRVAASLSQREGKFELAIGEADLFGGMANGTLSGSLSANGAVPVVVSIQAKALDLHPLLKTLGYPSPVAGKLNASINVDGNGMSMAQMKSTMFGKAQFTMPNAALNGYDLPNIIERAHNKDGQANGTDGGLTVLETVSGTFDIHSGIASTEDFLVSGAGLQVMAKGTVNLENGTLNGRGEAVLGTQEQEQKPQLPFIISGDIETPRFAPDPAWLLQRFGLAPEPSNSLQDVMRREFRKLTSRFRN